MRAFAIVSVLVVAQGALAQVDPAADHYKAGVTRFKAGQYTEAIQEFRAADAIRPSAVLSFNIAQCYEKMADLQNAKAAYQEYLRRAPTADDRAAIEATIASIDQKLAEKGQDTVVLVPSTAGSTTGEVQTTARRPDYTVGIITGGVGIAGLVAAVVLNAVSQQASSGLQNNGKGGNYYPLNPTPGVPNSTSGLYSTAQTTWTGAIIAYIGGGVLTAAGVGILGYQYFTRPTSP
jgi:tetratricopeptide (TPR) repeat protein